MGKSRYSLANYDFQKIDTYSSMFLDISIQPGHKNYNSHYGIGKYISKLQETKWIARGGNFWPGYQDFTGAYGLVLEAKENNSNIGFRCVYRPPTVSSDITAPTAPTNVSPSTSFTAPHVIALSISIMALFPEAIPRVAAHLHSIRRLSLPMSTFNGRCHIYYCFGRYLSLVSNQLHLASKCVAPAGISTCSSNPKPTYTCSHNIIYGE